MEVTAKRLNQLLEEESNLLVEFWGSWCPPCQGMNSVLEDLRREYDGSLSVAKVNVDKNPGAASKFDILGVPTFIVFQNGEIVQREVGAKSKKQLDRMVRAVME